jgi:hypothetical protein
LPGLQLRPARWAGSRRSGYIGLKNLAALADLPGEWIDKVHQWRPPKTIVLDMDSSDSPTYGEQEGSAYNGHFGCTCYSQCSYSINSAMSSAAR